MQRPQGPQNLHGNMEERREEITFTEGKSVKSSLSFKQKMICIRPFVLFLFHIKNVINEGNFPSSIGLVTGDRNEHDR